MSISFLADYNINGEAQYLWRLMARDGWLTLVDLRLHLFATLDLDPSLDDQALWRFAQREGYILLTANRRMLGKKSLEETIRKENFLTALPVLTVSSKDKLRSNHDYQQDCIERIFDIALYIERYLGAGRLYIP